MSVEITLSVPEEMMQLARKVADELKVSAESVVLDWLQNPIAHSNENAFLEALSSATDIQLWTRVYQDLNPKQQQSLQEIVDKHESGIPLSIYEETEWKELNGWNETLRLRRSKALLVLKERGFDVSRFFNPQRTYSE